MVHVPAKFRENTSMCFGVSAKTKRDGQTDRRTDRQTDGRCNISRPGPSAPWEITMTIWGLWVALQKLGLVQFASETFAHLNH